MDFTLDHTQKTLMTKFFKKPKRFGLDPALFSLLLEQKYFFKRSGSVTHNLTWNSNIKQKSRKKLMS